MPAMTPSRRRKTLKTSSRSYSWSRRGDASRSIPSFLTGVAEFITRPFESADPTPVAHAPFSLPSSRVIPHRADGHRTTYRGHGQEVPAVSGVGSKSLARKRSSERAVRQAMSMRTSEAVCLVPTQDARRRSNRRRPLILIALDPVKRRRPAAAADNAAIDP